jgi:hypothetical protein
MALSGSAWAELPAADQATVWLAASDVHLDRLRGGFGFGTGLMLSFGITRSVFANGQVIATTTLELPSLASLPAGAAASLGALPGTQALVVQNGPGNAIAADPPPMAVFIQNTLSNHTLGTQTVIHAGTNALSLVKNLNVQGTIQDALQGALGRR